MCLMAIYAHTVSAQDVIVKRDGSTILAKILKVGTSEVDYKKWSNQDGPSYAIAKSDLLSINYENGEKDDFSSVESSAKSDSQEEEKEAQFVKAPVNQALNSEIIAAYNSDAVKCIAKPKNDKPSVYWSQFYTCETSEFVNDDVLITYKIDYVDYSKINGEWSYEVEKLVDLKERYGKTAYLVHGGQVVSATVKNLTNKILYIDLSRTFLEANGYANPYYVPSSTTTSQGKSSGAGINLGGVAGALGIGGAVGSIVSGISVGGGSSSGTSTTTYSQKILSIPPRSSLSLPNMLLFTEEYCKYYTDVTFQKFARFVSIESVRLKSDTKRHNVQVYDKQNSPIKWGVLLTYSKEDDFNKFSTMSADFYLKKIIGVNNNGNAELGFYMKHPEKQLSGYENIPLQTLIRRAKD